MSKNKIIIVLLIMLSIAVISLYTTYAYEEGNILIQEESESDYYYLTQIKENSDREITVGTKEEKFIDIDLTNTLPKTIRYGMYYLPISPTVLPDNVTITLADWSVDLLENTIKPEQTRSISIKITNNSEYAINLIIGALIGYEYADIESTDGEFLIK